MNVWLSVFMAGGNKGEGRWEWQLGSWGKHLLPLLVAPRFSSGKLSISSE